jgi:hypothetical protein
MRAGTQNERIKHKMRTENTKCTQKTHNARRKHKMREENTKCAQKTINVRRKMRAGKQSAETVLWIPVPKTDTRERDKKNLLPYLFWGHKYHKIVNHIIFERKKFGPIYKELKNFLPKKLSIRYMEKKTFSGSRIQGQKDTGSATLRRNTICMDRRTSR